MGLASDAGNKWTATAREAVFRSKTVWVRMLADRTLGQYFTRDALDQNYMGEPNWPEDVGHRAIIDRAFGKDAIITDPDHPALQKLAGGPA